MFKGDDDTFESLFGKLISFASVKHSSTLDDEPTRAGVKKDPDATEADRNVWSGTTVEANPFARDCTAGKSCRPF